MAEARVLRERKKVVNYNDDTEQPRGQRKIADLLGEGRVTRTAKPADANDKENRKKRERTEPRSERVSDADESGNSDDDDVPARQPAKRAKAPALEADAEVSDAIEDSEGETNAFVAFARPGKRPAPRQQAKLPARPTRAAAARASQRISGAVRNDSKSGEPATGGRGRGRPTRTAAATAKERLRQGATDAQGGGSESIEDDDDASEHSEDSSGGSPVPRKAGGGRDDADVLMVDDSGSESDDEADDDEDMEDVEKDPVAKRTATRGRPTRACVVRAAAKAEPSRGRRRPEPSSEADDSDASDSEEADEEEEDGAPAKRGNSGGSLDSEDSDVKLVDDDSDEDEEGSEGEDNDDDDADDGVSGSEQEAADDDEAAAQTGRGKVSKEVAKLRETAMRRLQPSRGRGDKGHGQGGKDSKTAKASKAASKGKAAASNGKSGKGPKAKKAKDSSKAAGKEAKVAGGGGTGTSKKPSAPVERILSHDPEEDTYHVKLEGVSFRRTAHVPRAYLEKHKTLLLRSFHNREQEVEVDPDWLRVDRVIASRTVTRGRQGSARQLLVKWRGLEYSDSTWEYEEDLSSDADKAAIARFDRINSPTGSARGADVGAGGGSGNPEALRQQGFELPTFCNGRSLRDYQQVSVRWMVNNYSQRRNCVLGDEMGLGKTAQSISTLQTLRVVGGVPGPFLIVAPLSTLGHWQREIQTWTDMNAVLLAGSAADRAMIVEHEFYRGSSSSTGGRGGRGREIKFHVLLVAYEMLLKERSLLRTVSWAAAVFDEAHRLKGINSSTRAAVEEMDIDWLLLLTGTPIQNNMMELYSMLALLDPEGYPSPEDFTSRFGGAPGAPPPTVEQIRALQAALAPVLLRRMKEDVEELPQKEEVVVWVELTAYQRAYYRALYEGQIGALLGGLSKNLPSMRNLAMELRKLCCHPVLCDGLEDDLKLKLAHERSLAPPDEPQEFQSPDVELLVRGSGKMVLLHKLLHKLRAEGRRVLIFSQFVIMLNVLEDYCNAVGFPVERIDGNVKSRDRQQAIDRFSAEGEDSDTAAFVFLLSTRAGGQGITLTAADTCIIYDSDWNPQNDLQAMARCHRIGQKKEVTVYRLISRDTYEMALFNSASRKYGLDEAILGFSGGSDPESDSKRIADLLRNGAHGLLADMEAGLRQGEAFASEDINQILAARTEKRQIGSRAGNTFSVATFAADDGAAARGNKRGRARGGRGDGADDDSDEKDYWRTLMPEAVAAHEAKAAEGPLILGPRKRKQVNYNLNDKKYNPKLSDSDRDSDYEDGSGSAQDGSGATEGQQAEGAEPAGAKRKRQSRKKHAESAEAEGQDGAGGSGQEAGAAPAGGTGKGRPRKAGKVPGAWSRTELKLLEERVVALGPDRWNEVYEKLQPCQHTLEEVETAGRAMWDLYGVAAELAAQRKAAKKQAEEAARAASLAAAFFDDQDLFGAPRAPPPASAPTSAAGAGAGSTAQPAAAGAAPAMANDGAAAQAAAPAKVPDVFEQKLADLIPDKVPDVLHAALSGSTAVRRLLREAAENLRHGKMMLELARLMRPKLQQVKARENGEQQAVDAGATPGEGSSGACGGVNGLHATYMPPPITAGGFLNWWSRADDEALLIAAAQVGYLPGVPRTAVEHALRSQPLAGRVVLKPQPEDGDAGINPDDASKAVAPAAQPADVSSDQPMAEAGQQPQATAVTQPPPPRAPGPNGPLQLSADEWRIMLSILGRRLSKVVPASLDLHRKLNASAGKQPLAVVKPSRPSGPLPPPRDAMPTAVVAGAGQLPNGAAMAKAPAPPARPVQASTTVPATAVPVKVAPATAAPTTMAAVVSMAVATVNANTTRRLTGEPSPSVGASVKQSQQHQHQPTHPPGNVGATRPTVVSGTMPPQGSAQATQPDGSAAADPNRRMSGDAGQRQPDRTAAGAGVGAPTNAAAGSNKAAATKQKQSTLPFARLGGSSVHSKSAAATAVIGTVVKVAAPAAVAAGPAPGSAEKPIEVDESD